MKLFTKSKDPSWERIVHISVHRCDGIPEKINDKETYKILALDKGTLSFESGGMKKTVSAPAIIMLTDEETVFSYQKNVTTTTVFLRPTEIREEFTPERIASGEFEQGVSGTIYQDYLLIKPFEKESNKSHIALLPGLSAYTKISKIIRLMEEELTQQSDGYWPCRSRSYTIELLSFISYVCARSATHVVNEECNNPKAVGNLCKMYSEATEKEKSDIVSEIIQYLSEHIGDKVTLEDVMKEFSMNRNRLNELFVKETSMTCLAYLVKMRINLAQIMLAETELQIAEIAGRVGYPDSNYFIKVFKKHTGMTPSIYRESYSCFR